MGGCCCCLPRRTENRRTAEEDVPLSRQRPSSVVSAELEDTNGETSARNVPSGDETSIRLSHEETKGGTQTGLDLGPTMKKLEMELSKTIDPLFQKSFEEDVCPICLEEYETENPKMFTKCNHHFHLACILEWMERSEVCPICDKKVILIES